jgi:soluble lytic murein transglycosylase-like protein
MVSRIAFCIRCRGMRVGWNKRYILHRVFCKQWLGDTSRLGSLAILTAALLLAFPESPTVFSSDRSEQSIQRSEQPTQEAPLRAKMGMSAGPAVRTIDAFLQDHGVREANRSRLAQATVTSATKYNLDPRLIASIMIIESRGNPFAISDKNAIGIMQIHLPTWGHTADREGINLLKIEDNVDFGARVLKNYIGRFGLWEGVKRYNGFIAGNPTSEQSAQDYVSKVQRVYEVNQTAALHADIL